MIHAHELCPMGMYVIMNHDTWAWVMMHGYVACTCSRNMLHDHGSRDMIMDRDAYHVSCAMTKQA